MRHSLAPSTQQSGQKPTEVFATKGQARASLLIQIITSPGSAVFSKRRAQLETQDPASAPKGGFILTDVNTGTAAAATSQPCRIDNFNGKLWAKNPNAFVVDLEVEDLSGLTTGGDTT